MGAGSDDDVERVAGHATLAPSGRPIVGRDARPAGPGVSSQR